MNVRSKNELGLMQRSILFFIILLETDLLDTIHLIKNSDIFSVEIGCFSSKTSKQPISTHIFTHLTTKHTFWEKQTIMGCDASLFNRKDLPLEIKLRLLVWKKLAQEAPVHMKPLEPLDYWFNDSYLFSLFSTYF